MKLSCDSKTAIAPPETLDDKIAPKECEGECRSGRESGESKKRRLRRHSKRVKVFGVKAPRQRSSHRGECFTSAT